MVAGRVTAGASIGIALEGGNSASTTARRPTSRCPRQGRGKADTFFAPEEAADPVAAAAAPSADEPAAGRRGLSFRKPNVRRPALGQEPG